MRQMAIAVAALLVLAIISPAFAQPFADTPTNHWAYDAIAELAAKGLAGAVPGAAPKVRYEPRVYEATVLGLLMLVREFPDGWQTALIVGHNPGMAELTVGLAAPPPDPPSAFPTAAIAVLGLPGTWADAGPGEARLLAFAVPADMRLPRQHGPDLAGDLLVLAGGDHEGAHPRAVRADVVVVGAVPRVA